MISSSVLLLKIRKFFALSWEGLCEGLFVLVVRPVERVRQLETLCLVEREVLINNLGLDVLGLINAYPVVCLYHWKITIFQDSSSLSRYWKKDYP